MIPAGKERKEFGVPLCVFRHFPSSLCLPDLLLWHGVPLDPLFGHPPGQVTSSFSPELLMCPSGPTFTPPSVSTHRKLIREALMEADRLGAVSLGREGMKPAPARPASGGWVPGRSCQHLGGHHRLPALSQSPGVSRAVCERGHKGCCASPGALPGAGGPP